MASLHQCLRLSATPHLMPEEGRQLVTLMAVWSSHQGGAEAVSAQGLRAGRPPI